ncbi:MAG: ferredoxin family protein [Candidatus Bathyarchaeota archaeon]|nr:ferredoxin family protein [Candidatus Bathyarchaeota archaeon]
MVERAFHGVPRCMIPWYPIINYEKCGSCGKCVEYCKHGVYGFEEKQGKRKPFVKKADNCIVYCNCCDAVCPSGAISHPSKLETGKIISKLRKKME